MKLSEISKEKFFIGEGEDKVFYETIDEARIAAEELCKVLDDCPGEPIEVYRVEVKLVIKYTPSTTWRKEISF